MSQMTLKDNAIARKHGAKSVQYQIFESIPANTTRTFFIRPTETNPNTRIASSITQPVLTTTGDNPDKCFIPTWIYSGVQTYEDLILTGFSDGDVFMNSVRSSQILEQPITFPAVRESKSLIRITIQNTDATHAHTADFWLCGLLIEVEDVDDFYKELLGDDTKELLGEILKALEKGG